MAKTPRVRISSPPQNPKVPTSVRMGDSMNMDSLTNLATGMGIAGKDKSVSTVFAFAEMPKQQLDMAFRGDWVARKAVDIPAKDATREWRAWMSDKKDIGILEEHEKKHNIQRKTYGGLLRGRLYGGGALLLGVNQGTMDKELVVERIGKDQLQFVHVVSKFELSAGETDWDIGSPYYGQPSYYMRAGGDAMNSGQRIHPSRVIRFMGNEVPDVQLAQGWSDSIIQVIYDAVLAAGSVSQGGAQIVQEMKMDVIKIPELTRSLASKKYERLLNSRFSTANLMKSLYNLLVLDKDEDWERIETDLAGLPDTLKMYLLIASGAADIPATRFLSQSPAGLSATGESDMRNYYDMVKSQQVTEIQPGLRTLDEILIRSALGTTKPGDVIYEWRPLWQVSDKERAEVMKSKADSFNIDVTAALIPPEVLRDARINQLIEDGTYPGLEQILDDYGPLEDIEEEPEPGSVIGPDGKPIPPTDINHPNNQQQVDPKTGEPVAANNNAPPFAKKKAVGDMATRIRDTIGARKAAKQKKDAAFADARPRTLYVSRPVKNAAAIFAHYKKQNIPGLAEALPKDELHVTIMWTRSLLDWSKIGEPWDQEKDGSLRVPPGGMRMMDRFGPGPGDTLVMLFSSSDLAARHMSIRWSQEDQINVDYPQYQPHISIGKVDPAMTLEQLNAIEPYQGEILFGPERFEEVKEKGVGDA